jgi:hypothetical protein
VGSDTEHTIEVEIGRGGARRAIPARLLPRLRHGGGRRTEPPRFVFVLGRSPSGYPHMEQEHEAPEGPLEERPGVSLHSQYVIVLRGAKQYLRSGRPRT